MGNTSTQDQPILPVFQVSNTLAAANGTVTVPAAGSASALVSIAGTFTGTITLQGSTDGITWGNRLLFKSGVGSLGTASMTNAGTAIANEYRIVSGGLYIRALAGSTWSGSATVSIFASQDASTAFVNGPVHTAQEEAARAGRAFAASTPVVAAASGNFLNSYINNPSGSNVNLFVYKVTHGTDSTTTILQYNRIGGLSNAATAAPTAITPANANIGGAASNATLAYGMNATALAGTIIGTVGFIPINGIPADLPLTPTRVAPGQSFGYRISGVGGGLFTGTPPNMKTSYFYYEEAVN